MTILVVQFDKLFLKKTAHIYTTSWNWLADVQLNVAWEKMYDLGYVWNKIFAAGKALNIQSKTFGWSRITGELHGSGKQW